MDTAKLREDLVFTATLRGHCLAFHSTWGVFNPKGVDAGSRLLVEHIEVAPNATCLDLGCGCGPIGLTLACLAPHGQVHLVDRDFIAVEYARKNAQRNRLTHCQVYLSNAFSHVPPDLRFDLVASNLPAKVGNEMLTLILSDTWNRLKPGGHFYVVTVAGLKDYIKRSFRSVFGNYEKIRQGGTYTVARAVKE
tara:strand:+ start:656 stop:1234 length:579 start_codon:yes stop_codon:yes gene_type:complete